MPVRSVALVVLAVPPILAGTYAGVRNVDPAVVDAARGMGMRESQVLLQVELPNALPLILGGHPGGDAAGRSRPRRSPRTSRSAVSAGSSSTACAIRDYPQMAAGADARGAARLLVADRAGRWSSAGRVARPARRRPQRAGSDRRSASSDPAPPSPPDPTRNVAEASIA